MTRAVYRLQPVDPVDALNAIREIVGLAALPPYERVFYKEDDVRVTTGKELEEFDKGRFLWTKTQFERKE